VLAFRRDDALRPVQWSVKPRFRDSGAPASVWTRAEIQPNHPRAHGATLISPRRVYLRRFHVERVECRFATSLEVAAPRPKYVRLKKREPWDGSSQLEMHMGVGVAARRPVHATGSCARCGRSFALMSSSRPGLGAVLTACSERRGRGCRDCTRRRSRAELRAVLAGMIAAADPAVRPDPNRCRAPRAPRGEAAAPRISAPRRSRRSTWNSRGTSRARRHARHAPDDRGAVNRPLAQVWRWVHAGLDVPSRRPPHVGGAWY
jgi:hypothetical protein